MDLKLDPNTHDLVFDNDSVAVTESITDSVAQKLKVKLLTFLGEWKLDTSYGVPYMQEIFGKRRNKNTVDTIFQKLILEEPLVKEISSFQSSLGQDRSYSLTFKVKDISGDISSDVEIDIGGI